MVYHILTLGRVNSKGYDLNYMNYLPTRSPVRIEIVSAAENVPLLNRDLDLIVKDASKYCEYSWYLDEDGITRIRIVCTISDEEKEYIWDVFRFKHGRHSSISSEPSMLYG
jgi:hypothetical protein